MKRAVFLLFSAFLFPVFLPAQTLVIRNIRNIFIEGNEKTRDEVIRTIIRTREGDLFTFDTSLIRPTVSSIIWKINGNSLRWRQHTAGKKIKSTSLSMSGINGWSLLLAPYYSYRDKDYRDKDHSGFHFPGKQFFGLSEYSAVLSSMNKTTNGNLLFSHPRLLGTSFSYVAMFSRLYEPFPIYERNQSSAVFSGMKYSKLRT